MILLMLCTLTEPALNFSLGVELSCYVPYFLCYWTDLLQKSTNKRIAQTFNEKRREKGIWFFFSKTDA